MQNGQMTEDEQSKAAETDSEVRTEDAERGRPWKHPNTGPSCSTTNGGTSGAVLTICNYLYHLFLCELFLPPE